ncbi:16S rRNA methyltransferase [Corynebacterium phocae]|uniref:Ribosomal RNA small subunit methyltransferase E n=1 Tax=Corynebacterium phocae TaxID=161895 RepID=A0A1L7D258_9CORY|nr:16S rRNA (uracil(1498)-N(3))-methyltransferase [Corynebacterium phocae]APT92112.1 16S rRNA methyltransferase [Corynebacterium phocae]KAA8726499.1 16S rRNA (uracil(1498)-N(3))-methyltransferase [Corynebacterium phocae]
MSLPVFLHPDLSAAAPGSSVAIDGAEGRHAVTVKRVQPGQQVALVDPEGFRAEVTVTDVQGKDLLVGTVGAIAQVPEPDPRVVVIQAIPKSERAELAVDLATQAGADEIIAWQADRCVAKWDGKKAHKAVAKWQAAATAAAKQSRRPRVPRVSGPLSTAQVAQLIGNGNPGATTAPGPAPATAFVLHEEGQTSLKDVPQDQLRGTIYLLIGPEGGIGPEELQRLGATAVRLGPEVLRTASAAMVALAVLGVRTNRW